MFWGIDPLYLILLVPTMILAGIAQSKVKSAFAAGKKIQPASGMSGADAARRILARAGATDVRIEPSRGFLSDHYDPRGRVLRLSPDVYQGRTISAVGVAAHEAGHALQDAHGYMPLKIRNAIVPMASLGSNMSMGLFMIGLIMAYMTGSVRTGQPGLGQYLMIGGIILFSLAVVFQIINLPVEFDASSRARKLLVSEGIVAPQQDAQVGKVLNAAAMTYVAATIGAIMTLVYMLIRSGLLGGSRD